MRVLADPINTREFAVLEPALTFSTRPGQGDVWRAVLPTLRRAGERFRLGIKVEDAWSNPSDQVDATVHLHASRRVRGLPERATIRPGEFTFTADGLQVDEPGDVEIEVLDTDGHILAVSNPLRVVPEAELVSFWGDLHWQSRETVGMGTAGEGFAFARDKAFIDVTSHAGNDLQMTREIWAYLNRVFAQFDEPGRFVALPGYEWSGNTPVGGDRNVFYCKEGGVLRRSSHILVPDRSDADTDCLDAHRLFEALAADGEEALTWAHVGGRHCDIKYAHVARLETAIEVHSTYWGTFEWLIRDAFEAGYRVGFVCNSDDHKGRPGASAAGFAEYGNAGGLTCFLMPELSRASLWMCMRRRHHYGTTGTRLHLDVRARPVGRALLFDEDPKWSDGPGQQADELIMGDIARIEADAVEFEVHVLSPTPIHRVEIRNGLELLEIVHPYAEDELGDRVQITFEGAEFRGRAPRTVWDGEAAFSDARIREARPISFALKSKSFTRDGERTLRWTNITTGDVVGFEAWLEDGRAGTLRVTTPQGREEVALADLGLGERVFDYGKLDRRMRIFRLPEENSHKALQLRRQIRLRPHGDNPLYVCLTLEDGQQAWSSPIYLFW